MSHQSNDRAVRKAAWQAVSVFMAFTLVLTALFGGLMANLGATPILLVTGVMWAPGLGAILTCLALRRPIGSLPWRWASWKMSWFVWALPIAYGLLIYTPVWLLGLGGSGFGNPETLSDWTHQLIGIDRPSILAASVFVVILATMGVIMSASRALGEEIGWRGFLIWELRKVMPFWAVCLLSGFIWAVWHWPAIIMTDYNAGVGNVYLQVFIFTVTLVPKGITFAYITFKSNSLWPAAILHASHNLFIQRVFTPLTTPGEGTHLYIDEFGIMMPIFGVLLAAYFYRRAVKEGIA